MEHVTAVIRRPCVDAMLAERQMTGVDHGVRGDRYSANDAKHHSVSVVSEDASREKSDIYKSAASEARLPFVVVVVASALVAASTFNSATRDHSATLARPA